MLDVAAAMTTAVGHVNDVVAPLAASQTAYKQAAAYHTVIPVGRHEVPAA